MQSDKEIHLFRNNADFKEVITRYKYDKELRILLFGAIETIEVALRTKLIYHLSQSYSGQFYTQPSLFVKTKQSFKSKLQLWNPNFYVVMSLSSRSSKQSMEFGTVEYVLI